MLHSAASSAILRMVTRLCPASLAELPKGLGACEMLGLEIREAFGDTPAGNTQGHDQHGAATTSLYGTAR